MARLARDRLWRSLTDYEFTAWAWHGLRLVNGHFRGVDVQRVPADEGGAARRDPGRAEPLGASPGQPAPREQRPRRPQHRLRARDAGGAGGVLARPAPALPARRLDRDRGVPQPCRLARRGRRSRSGEEPSTPPAAARLRDLRACSATTSRRSWRCGTPARLRRSDGTERVSTSSSPRRRDPRVLMVSQMYRPGWRAKLSDGRTVDGLPALRRRDRLRHPGRRQLGARSPSIRPRGSSSRRSAGRRAPQARFSSPRSPYGAGAPDPDPAEDRRYDRRPCRSPRRSTCRPRLRH